jgi:hypothetical protein
VGVKGIGVCMREGEREGERDSETQILKHSTKLNTHTQRSTWASWKVFLPRDLAKTQLCFSGCPCLPCRPAPLITCSLTGAGPLVLPWPEGMTIDKWEPQDYSCHQGLCCCPLGSDLGSRLVLLLQFPLSILTACSHEGQVRGQGCHLDCGSSLLWDESVDFT